MRPPPARRRRRGPRRAAPRREARARAPRAASGRRPRRRAPDAPRTGSRSRRRRRRRRAGSRDGDPGDLAELPLQVANVRLRVDLRAGRAHERLARRELAPVPVEVLAQPLAQVGEVAALDARVEVAEVGARLLPDLDGHDVPERVRREVAEPGVGPVDVLEDAGARIRHVYAEVGVHPLVEGLRQVARLEPAREERPLELEAQDDVQVVRDLVRVDPRERGPDPVHRAEEPVGLDVAEARERPPQVVVGEAPERAAAADEVLPHPALRLVQRRRRAGRERRPRERRRDLPFVETAPELLDRGEDPAEVRLPEVRRQPDVGDPQARREGMLAVVEPPGAAVRPAPLEQVDREGPLPFDRERPLQLVAVRLARRLDERDELALQVLEDVLGLRGREAVLVVVEEHVVRLAGRLEAVDVAPPELEQPLEVRAEHLEVAPLARLQPGAVAERTFPQELGPQLGRHPARLLVVAAHDADQARLVRLVRERLLFCAQLLEQAAQLVGHEPLVRGAPDRRPLLGACRSGVRRHRRLHVPREQKADPLQVVDLAEEDLQPLECLTHAPTMLNPPSQRTKLPVMCAESSLARNTTTPASSSGFGMRPSGVCARTASRRPERQSSRMIVDSVSMKPGPSAFTRTRGANACAYDFVRPSTPYFEAAYCGARGLPVTTTFEHTFTIPPPPACSSMPPPTSCVTSSVPFTSTASTRSISSSDTSRQDICSGATSPTLFTSTSRRPKRSNTSAASRRMSSQLRRSAWTANASRPRSRISATASSAPSRDVA